MRQRWWVAIASLCGVLLVLVVVWAQGGPIYNGRSLRAWLRGFDANTAEARWRSAEAFRHMGSGVVPRLIPQLAHSHRGPEAKWKHWVWDLLARQSLVNVAPFWEIDERGEALAALDALGPDAKTAVPALESLLHETRPDCRALMVLARIGPDAVPVLDRALTNDQPLVRASARACLDAIKSHSKLVFPNTPQDSEFSLRTCRFNLLVLQAVFREYKVQHAEDFLSDSFDSRPPLQLPPVSMSNSSPSSPTP